MPLVRTKKGCGCAIAVLVAFLGVAAFVGYKFIWPLWQKAPPTPSGEDLRVIVLDVGQGDSILIISPEGKAALIDAGDEKNGKTVVEALKRNNVQQIDYFIATHFHPDHIGGADEVFSNFKVLNVLHNDFPPSEAMAQAETPNKNANARGQKPAPKVVGRQPKNLQLPTVRAYNDFKAALDASGAQIRKAEPDEKRLALGGGATLMVLAPLPPLFTRDQINSSRSGNESNANSIVVRLDYGEFSMLLTGDAETPTEERLTGREANIAAMVLKVSHHGSKYASSDEFLRRVKAEAAIISLGEGPGIRYGHPSKLALERLQRAGITKLFRTDLHGEITITTKGSVKDGKLYDITAAKTTSSDPWAGRDGTKDDSSRAGFIAYGEYAPPPKPRKK